MATLDAYNSSCKVGHFDHTALDDCHTEGLAPAKTHWARPLDTGPYYGYALRPGVTFTYLGLKVDDTSAVRFKDQPSQNLFVAGEMMAGNVLGRATPPVWACRSARPLAVSPGAMPPWRLLANPPCMAP